MAILSREEAFTILDKVLGFSRAAGCEASLEGSAGGNIRYARNTVTTSGSVEDMTLQVQSNFGKRRATATINEFDDRSLERLVRRSEELARLAPENQEFMEVLGPQKYLESRAFFASTAGITPQNRARAAAHSIEPSREKDLVAAGFLDDSAGFRAMANSKGLKAYHRSTEVNFSVTVRTGDGTGSGYVRRDHNDVGKLDTGEASRIAIDKAVRSRKPRPIEPGKYTVVLEPAASSSLLWNLVRSFNARQADEGRSFLSKPGGGTRLGEKLFGEDVNLYSDPTHPEIPASPFAENGLPREKIHWVEKGVVKNLLYSRFWAREKGVKPIPFPGNRIMEGGEPTLEDLIRGTKKGILVSRTWYIRTVDPQTLLLTGLTRDGTFWIENGEIAYPIKNMRWNDSPVKMLNRLEALGRPERVRNSLVPPMRIGDFEFTSLSDAV